MTKSSSNDYNVTDLFNQIYNEMESPDRKKIRGDITRFYLRTSESIKVPETELSYYRMAKVIGKGSFGKVYLGQQVLTSRLVAIKCLEKNHMKDRGVREKILQEIDILKTASQGSGITRLYEVFENKTSVFLVMAYARSGDLLRYLKSKTRLEESEAKRLFLPILTAVCGLHSRNILHRDIKLDNILLDEHNSPSLCDFGVSRKMNEREAIYEQCGTPAYIAPEIINDKGYSGFKADVWSLGVMLFAMLTGKMPFKGSTIEDLHGAITTGSYAFPPEPKLSAEAKELILKMMKVDTKERLSSLQVLNEKWLGLSSQEVVSISSCWLCGSIGLAITERTLDHRVFIDPKIVERVSSLGYPEKVIANSLQMRKLNHATACYYTLEKGQTMFSSGQEV